MFYRLARSILFHMQPETAHKVIMSNLGWAEAIRLTRLVASQPVSAPVRVMGLDFPNAVGLAAGMDKDAAHVSAFGALGFGHVEVGTITPRPQAGNPKPRLWRLIPAEGIVNHMGFNNCGVEAAKHNLASAKDFRAAGGIVGINIGKQNSTPAENALPDYQFCMRELYQYADYLAIDISCPNTPGLTALQDAEALRPLVRGIAEQRSELEDQYARYVPITVKIAPDLTDDAVRAAADIFVDCGMDAITATNTTVSRPGVERLLKPEMVGGLSGRPLFDLSTHTLNVLSDHLEGQLPLIAVGGVMDVQTALAKQEAGASLVQLYTGFIYNGPRLIGDVAKAWG